MIDDTNPADVHISLPECKAEVDWDTILSSYFQRSKYGKGSDTVYDENVRKSYEVLAAEMRVTAHHEYEYQKVWDCYTRC